LSIANFLLIEYFIFARAAANLFPSKVPPTDYYRIHEHRGIAYLRHPVFSWSIAIIFFFIVMILYLPLWVIMLL
jgi:hypothetical protein